MKNEYIFDDIVGNFHYRKHYPTKPHRIVITIHLFILMI